MFKINVDFNVAVHGKHTRSRSCEAFSGISSSRGITIRRDIVRSLDDTRERSRTYASVFSCAVGSIQHGGDNGSRDGSRQGD